MNTPIGNTAQAIVEIVLFAVLTYWACKNKSYIAATIFAVFAILLIGWLGEFGRITQ